MFWYAGGRSTSFVLDLQKYELFLNGGENRPESAGNRRQFPHRLGLGLVQQVGVDAGGSDVRMAHQLLHSIYRDILGQQQHAESVPRAMERDGFLCFMLHALMNTSYSMQ